MLSCVLICAFAVMVLGILAGDSQANVLSIGDPAPAIAVKKFVKGTAVTGFEKGKLYVVEFWATWCGPCRQSIPHLTELAKQYKEITFIGVSVWEQDQEGVEPFVKQMGDRMDYSVALDIVAEGQNGRDGEMAVTWMRAAVQKGIPTAFIIDKESKIVWIGHPMEMEEPLGKIVAGNWDLKAAAEKVQQARDEQVRWENSKQGVLYAKLRPLREAKDYAGALNLIDKSLKSDPDLETIFGPNRLNLLILLKKDAEALDYATRLAEINKKDAMRLNGLAWTLIDPANPIKPSADLIDLGVNVAIHADELMKSPDILDTLATAYFVQGNVELAIETAACAVKMVKGTEREAEFDAILLKFQQAKQ